MTKLSEELAWRGFTNQTTFSDIKILDGPAITFYWGVDPSASSMTVGNLALAIMVKHFINHGHKAILLVGGATGMIGDPDGKTDERSLKSIEEVQTNKIAIQKQYQQIFDGLDFKLVDNYDWFKNINYLDFLRTVGKNVPMSQMLGREFVQSRLGENGSGISYAEFSYALIQGYDFVYLNNNYGVTLQVCGSDQWGNSIAGVELLRRLNSVEANIWSAPLVINKSTGKKFGKSEDGAVWLDEKLTSVYSFYQFWLNVDDAGVEDYLKIYTFLSKDEIDSTVKQFKQNPSDRLAQKTLAYEITKIVHGENRAKSVKKISEVLFDSRKYTDLNNDDFELMSQELGLYKVDKKDLSTLLVDTKLAKSKSEARRFLDAGSIYINGKQIGSDQANINENQFISNYAIVRRGKNTQVVIKK